MVETMENIRHYTAYRTRPLTDEQRRSITILFGGLTWKHERLIQGVLHNLNYNAEPLPNITREDLDAGKELIDVGACCPTIFTTGNLVTYLKKKSQVEGRDYVANNYAFVTAGACGPCRFGQYHESYTMALSGLGLEDFRLFLLSQNKLDQGDNGGGLNFSLPFTTGVVWAILCADILTDMEYLTRPYEVIPGQTDQVLQESIEYLYDVFHNRPIRGKKWGNLAWHLTTSYFTGALKQIKKKWDAVEVDRLQVKPKVKITGEFWLQTHEGDGNYNIKRWLEQEGAEVIPPPVAVWLDYLLHSKYFDLENRKELEKRPALKMALIQGLARLYRRTYDGLRKALGFVPYALPDQFELRRLADPYYHYRLRGGEGHMLVGKALYAYHHKRAHMICELSPYSCMPNTMSIGAMAKVLGQYPDLLYAPIEVKGDAEVHALSRCQMILTEAKQRAQMEFDEVLDRYGLTLDKLRELEAKQPRLRRATFRVPHYGYAGTAVNYAIYLATK